jgi:hypothetical protein
MTEQQKPAYLDGTALMPFQSLSVKEPWEAAPFLGASVHYVSYGTPGGEYGKKCRAAIVTATGEHPDADGTCSLHVMNPTGQFWPQAVHHSEDHRNPADLKGLAGGTWHWPGGCGK